MKTISLFDSAMLKSATSGALLTVMFILLMAASSLGL